MVWPVTHSYFLCHQSDPSRAISGGGAVTTILVATSAALILLLITAAALTMVTILVVKRAVRKTALRQEHGECERLASSCALYSAVVVIWFQPGGDGDVQFTATDTAPTYEVTKGRVEPLPADEGNISQGIYSNPHYMEPGSHRVMTGTATICSASNYENSPSVLGHSTRSVPASPSVQGHSTRSVPASPSVQGHSKQSLPAYQSLQENTVCYESMYTIVSPPLSTGQQRHQPAVSAGQQKHQPAVLGNGYTDLHSGNREHHIYTALGKQ